MPRNPEWVKPKEYARWEPKWKGPMKLDRAAEEEPGKPKKPGKVKIKDPADEKPGKPRKPGKSGTVKDPTDTPRGSEDPGGPKKRPPTARKAIDEGTPSGRRTRPPRPTGPATPRLPGPKAPGQEVELGTPRRRWGGFAEVVRPPAIGGRPPSREHAPPERRALPTSERQFGQRELPTANHPSFEGTRIGEMERRRADLANLVSEVRERQAKQRKELPGVDTGEIVSEGATSQRAAHNDRSVWDAEVVGHNDGNGTSEIRAISPPSHDATTGPIPRIRTDDTIRLRPARAGDTSSFEPISGNLIHPDAPKTGPDHESTRGFQVIQGSVHPDRIGLTQHPEPLGQMSLFPGPERDRHLSEAQAGREERRAITPPSMPPGRQVNFMRTNLPKKPGSQGTLFQPVTFKTL